MNFDFITVQKISLYDVYKGEFFLWSIGVSFCQFFKSIYFMVNLLRSEFALMLIF